MAVADEAGLPRSTLIAAFVAILLVGFFAFLVVNWSTSRTEAAELRTQISDLEASLEQRRAELAPTMRELETLRGQTDLFARGRMCVSNPTDVPVKIQKLAVVYLDENGEFQTFNSGVYGSDLWTIESGHAGQQLSYPRGGWDGSVTYYAMWLEAEGQDGPRSEVWPLDPEYCVQLPWSGA